MEGTLFIGNPDNNSEYINTIVNNIVTLDLAFKNATFGIESVAVEDIKNRFEYLYLDLREYRDSLD